MATARTVSTLLKNQLQPILSEAGFDVNGRTSVKRDGRSGSTISAQYLPVSPPHLEPHIPDIGETQLLALLSVTSDASATIDRQDVWPVHDKPGAEAAVADLARAVRRQAMPLLELTPDPMYQRRLEVLT